MNKFAKFVTVLGATALFGYANAQQNQSEYAVWQLLDEYQASMPALVGWGDYASASRVALAIAMERNKLEGTTPAVCQALAKSREFARMASKGRSREDFSVLAGVQEGTGSMARVRATCAQSPEVAARGDAAGF